MVSSTVELRNVMGTEAAMGWAGSHTIIVDRPEGKAGGLGLGFNGAQLLALAIGGCFCNELRSTAHRDGVKVGNVSVSVTVDMDGDPLLTRRATMSVSCETSDGSNPKDIIEKAVSSCMVSNSVTKGFPVAIEVSV